MTITKAQIEGIAAQAYNMARTEWNHKGGFNFIMASYHPGDIPPLHRMTTVEALIVEKLGVDWLNYSDKKSMAMRIIRLATRVLPPPAFVMVTIADMWRTTPKFETITPAEKEHILKGPRSAREAAVKRGLLETKEVIGAMVQTPELFCMYQRPLHDELAPAAVDVFPIDEFDGTMKVFGAEPTEAPDSPEVH